MNDKPILILEDEVVIAWDIEAELQTRGWQVGQPVGNPNEALNQLEAGEFGAAVLDINLGNSNSFDVARECLQRSIPVLFLTGDSGESRPADLQAIGIVSKPIDFDNLHKALLGMLETP